MEQSWSVQQGAPESIRSMAQTSDGYLWLAGPGGLFRFDGTRFERFHSSSDDQLLSTNVSVIFAPPTGGLWIGYTFGGLSFVNDGRVKSYLSAPADHAATGTVNSFAQDSKGSLWAATNGGLWQFDGSTWRRSGIEWHTPVVELGFDRAGTLWAIADDHTLLSLVPGSKEFRVAKQNLDTPARLTRDADQHVVTNPDLLPHATQFIDKDGNVWILDDLRPPNFRSLIDREGNIWFCNGNGVHRFFHASFVKQEGIVEDQAPAVAADENGGVWMTGTSESGLTKLYRLIDGTIYNAECGDPAVWGLAYRAPDRTLWFGGERGLCHLVDQVPHRIAFPTELAGQERFLNTLTEDRAGGLWVSFGRHGLYRLADGEWTSFGGRQDLPRTPATIIFTDSLWRIWFGYPLNRLSVLDGDKVRVFGPSDGVRVGNVTAISGREPGIWIGGEFGLQKFHDGRFRSVHAVDDDWLLGVSGIVETAGGDLWLNGLTGIFHIDRAEIAESLRDPSYRVRGEHIGSRDGLPGFAAQIRPLPTAIQGTDGRLWFALSSGLVWLDPAHVHQRAFVAPITIQSVSADEKNYGVNSPPTLPARTSSVTIRYSAISLSHPEAIRSRVKLRETDSDWHEVTTGEPVTYRSLPPGHYHFAVAASDTNGVWSAKGANLVFTVLPAWYQTAWFYALCALALLILLWSVYRLRLRQLQGQFAVGLQERVNERTRIARELHDTLLQSFQGVAFQIQAARNLLLRNAGNAAEVLDGAIATTEEAIREGRSAIRDLRPEPAARRNLPELLNDAGREIQRTQELHGNVPTYRVLVEGRQQDLSPTLQDEIYRISREVIRNAFAHATASHIEVEIRYDQYQLRLRLRDDGKGIDPKVLEAGGQSEHFGIAGIRERARRIGAQLDFWSEEGAGTEVQLTIPGSMAYERRRDGGRFPPFRWVGTRERRS